LATTVSPSVSYLIPLDVLDAVKDYLIKTKQACLTRRQRAQRLSEPESSPGIRLEHWLEHWLDPLDVLGSDNTPSSTLVGLNLRVASGAARYDGAFERGSGERAASALVGWCLLFPPQLSYATLCHTRHQVTAPVIYKYLFSHATYANQQVEDFSTDEPPWARVNTGWGTSIRRRAIAPNRELAHWKIACAQYIQ
jgi:hypothetical protein